MENNIAYQNLIYKLFITFIKYNVFLYKWIKKIKSNFLIRFNFEILNDLDDFLIPREQL